MIEAIYPSEELHQDGVIEEPTPSIDVVEPLQPLVAFPGGQVITDWRQQETCCPLDDQESGEEVIQLALKQSVKPAPEFEKKRLATHSLNIGLACDHWCAYCSTPSLVRRHPVFEQHGATSFDCRWAIVDPSIPERVHQRAAKLPPEAMVMLCTTTDAWSPAAQQFALGRRCLEALLEGTQCQVRILTKNTAVTKDYDVLARHPGRVRLGLSVTSPPSREHLAQILEPQASSITKRLKALRQAHALGIRTYGMLSPCLPGLALMPQCLREMMQAVLKCGAEEIWLEPVNPRGNGLIRCVDALKWAGEAETAQWINQIRSYQVWSAYVRALVENAIGVATELGVIDLLRILIYPRRLEYEDRAAMSDLPGVIWL